MIRVTLSWNADGAGRVCSFAQRLERMRHSKAMKASRLDEMIERRGLVDST